jgi:hypothetical protein
VKTRVSSGKKRGRRVLVEWSLPRIFGKRFEFPGVSNDNVREGKSGRWSDSRGLPG